MKQINILCETREMSGEIKQATMQFAVHYAVCNGS